MYALIVYVRGTRVFVCACYWLGPTVATVDAVAGVFLFRGRANNSSSSLSSLVPFVCKRHTLRGRKKEAVRKLRVFFFFQRLSALKTRPCLLLSFKTEIWLFLYLIFSRVQLFVSSPQLRRRIVRSGWQWRATGVSQSFAIFVVDM